MPEYGAFYDEMSQMGYPNKLRKIALANGSGIGKAQAGISAGNDVVSWDYYDSGNCTDVGSSPVPYKIFAVVRAIGPQVDIFDAEVKVCWFLNAILRYEIKSDVKHALSSVKPYDSAPGGYFNAPQLIGSTDTGGYGNIVVHSPVTAFIPTISALDIRTDDLFYNIKTDPDILSKTPFNAIYYPSVTNENEAHVSITPEKKDILLREIEGFGWLPGVFYLLL